MTMGLLMILDILSKNMLLIMKIFMLITRKMKVKVLPEEFPQDGDLEMPVLLGYTGTSDELLQKYIAESGEYWGGRTFPSTIVGSTVGTHAGPGAVAVAFFIKE